MELLSFLNGSGLSLFDLYLGGLDMLSGFVLVLLDFVELFCFEALNVAAGVLVDFLDVRFGKGLFVPLNDVMLNIIVTVEPDGSVGDA